MGASHPSEHELAALAWGGTAVGVDVADHLAACALCRAIVAAKHRTDPSAHGPTLAPGTMIGRYRIEACLGAGGMGIVYRAHDGELDRAVALKLVRPHGDIEVLTARLRRESRLQARAAHRSVITIYDIGHHGDQLFVAMELIEGTTLADWLERAPRPWRRILDVFRDAASGLAAAHAAGLVHRDFKPDNVLVELRGGDVTRVAVADFGIARALESAAEDVDPESASTAVDITATGGMIGTPAYMSPEQLHAAEVDERSDVFSFSVALWEALYGERPFPGDNIAVIASAMDAGPPSIPLQRAPRWVGRALLGGLAVDRAVRTPSITALVAQLHWRRRARKRRVALVGGSAVVATAALALGWYALVPDAPAQRSPCEDTVLTGLQLAAARGAVDRASWGARPQLGAYWRAAAGDYITRWSRMRDATCGAASAAGADERARCLDQLGGDAAALVAGAVALDDARRDDVLRAVTLVAPAECMSAAAGALAALHPDVESVRAARLALAEAEGELDRDGSARGRLAAARARVAAAGFAPLAHELALVETRTIAATQEYATATRRVAFAAQTAGHLAVAVRGLELASVALQRDRDIHLAADAALQRAGDPPRDRASWHIEEAWLAEWVNDRAAVQAEIAKARALLEGAGVPYDLELEARLAALYLHEGKLADAERLLDAALAFATATGMASAGRLRELHNGRATVLVETDRTAAALGELAPMLAGIDPDRRLPDKRLTRTIGMIAHAHLAAGAPAEAIATLDRWQPAITATLEPDAPEAPSLLTTRARALLTLGRTRDAEQPAQRAVELDVRHFGDRAAQTIVARLLLGSILAELPEAGARAIAELQRALADEATGAKIHPMLLVNGRYILGDLLIQRGRVREARVLAEQVVAAFDTTAAGPIPDRGLARWLLARTLPSSDRARVRTLVAGALADWSADPGSYKSEIASARRSLR